MICPYCKTDNALGATRCAACTSWIVERPPVREWTRARQGRLLGGVARGLSSRFGIPIAAVRLLFLLSIPFGGWSILVYVALWIAMPLEPAPAAIVPSAGADVPAPRPEA
jgi:phage shock protein PspC (stress-responsive transcriptional regulator)